jgi:hypothetical protein
VVALAGGAYGTVLGVTEGHGAAGSAANGVKPSSDRPASSDLASHLRPPAGRGDPLPWPDMEHTHAR